MTNDSGNWLSAEQAVLPDGTERENLSLINKKLPALAPLADGSATEPAEQAARTSREAS